MHERLHIGAGAEDVPALQELRAQLPKVVDLAVAQHGDVPVLIPDRLMAPR